MRELGKILVVSQHYPPDPTTTATYIGEIARALAADRRVVVLSGSPHSAASADANPASGRDRRRGRAKGCIGATGDCDQLAGDPDVLCNVAAG